MFKSQVILAVFLVQGTSVRRVRVRAYKRVRGGKTQFVKTPPHGGFFVYLYPNPPAGPRRGE